MPLDSAIGKNIDILKWVNCLAGPLTELFKKMEQYLCTEKIEILREFALGFSFKICKPIKKIIWGRGGTSTIRGRQITFAITFANYIRKSNCTNCTPKKIHKHGGSAAGWHSMGSPRAVPVPWHSTRLTARGRVGLLLRGLRAHSYTSDASHPVTKC